MIVKYDNREIRLPDFLIGGTARSGTSSLYFYVRSHPDVFMPQFKEPHFFSFFGKQHFYADIKLQTIDGYSDLFVPAKAGQLCGEASASYLYYYRDAIKNIQEIYREKARELKFIFILRNPVDRAWSLYNLMLRDGNEIPFFELIKQYEKEKDEDFPHWFNFIRMGKYTEQLRAYCDAFPNINIYLFNDLENRTASVVKSVFSCLGVNDEFVPTNLKTVYNASGKPNNPFLKPVYDVLFREGTLKNAFKNLIPYNTRQSIKNFIGNRMLVKEDMPADIKKYLVSTFRPEIEELAGFIKDKQQKDVIKNWV